MDEFMVEKWNSIVTDNDTVYHLGDVYFPKSRPADGKYFDNLLGSLRGRKELILGNHDKGKNEILSKHFSKIHGVLELRKHNVVLSHYPLHRSCFGKEEANIHGHIHNNYFILDSSYFNASVELHDYSPILLESLVN
jgi:calcineurin-like phosphoesterase family protein